MYLLAEVGLCCCARAFPSCRERALLFVAVRGLLIAVDSLVEEHGLQTCGLSSYGLQALEHSRMGLVAPQHVESSQTRARTRVPCIGRRILNHCATREVLPLFFKISIVGIQAVRLWSFLFYISLHFIKNMLCVFKRKQSTTCSKKKDKSVQWSSVQELAFWGENLRARCFSLNPHTTSVSLLPKRKWRQLR